MTSETRSSVLVAYDGSPAAETALPIALRIARQLDADLRILQVRTPDEPPAMLDASVASKTCDARLLVVDSASPAAGILMVSDDPTVRLVVLTTHGRYIEEGRPLGRVAEEVIAHAVQPVLLVRPEAPQSVDKKPPELRRLLVPLDGTPSTAAVLQPATALAQHLDASLDLLHVAADAQPAEEEIGSITAPRYVDQPQHSWPEWAREFADRVNAAGANIPEDVSTRTFLAHGQAEDEIRRFSEEHPIDAIVVARRSHLEPGRAPILRALLACTPCPILLVGSMSPAKEPYLPLVQ